VSDRVTAPRPTRSRRSADGPVLFGLPAVKAVPAELVCSSDLVRETERVDPSLLFGAPAAVPGEFDHSRFSGTFDDYRADEIGAAGPGVDVQSLDRPLWVSVEDLVHETDQLDPRHGARVRDRRGIDTRREGDDVSLELLGGGRPREELGVYRHGRNISGGEGGSNTNVLSLQTKLTVRSEQPFRR
jgi:hypothetical protein